MISSRCIHHCLRTTSLSARPLRRFTTTAYQLQADGLKQKKNFVVLGIETSCDDTSVALIQRTTTHDHHTNAPHLESKAVADGDDGDGGDALIRSTATIKLLFHKTITSDNRRFGGIHPLISLESHRTHLAKLVREALGSLNSLDRRKKEDDVEVGAVTRRIVPDLVAATRGPGMRSSLAVGLDTAKGLAVAWGVPLVGVHHMQAHALTPRFVDALERGLGPKSEEEERAATSALAGRPDFPFLTLLVSGGHTMLLHSTALTEHRILASTCDVAIGDMIDKCARVLLSEKVLAKMKDTGGHNIAYGKLLENYVFPGAIAGDGGSYDYGYHPLRTVKRGVDDMLLREKWKWAPLPVPFEQTMSKHNLMAFSFAGLGSCVESEVVQKGGGAGDMSEEERKCLGREVMKVAFEHLARRVFLALRDMEKKNAGDEKQARVAPKTLVVSGGVASNKFLRHVLYTYLASAGHPDIQLICPPPSLCTDNAAMIAWAGLEMYGAGWETDLDVHPVRTWYLDSERGDDGFFSVGGWKRTNEVEAENSI